MKSNIQDFIEPHGIYTGAQVIELTGMPSSTFYLYVKRGKIPKHEREIDSRTVYLGHEILKALTSIKDKVPMVFFVKPRRGRPPKRQGNP